MAKKTKPNLQGYLKTGKRLVSEPEQAPGGPGSFSAFWDLLSPPDRQMWESMLSAGIKVRLHNLDTDSMREAFRTMDRTRFTCYALAGKGAPLCPVRSGSQINDSLTLLLEWDEMGILTVYSAARKETTT